MFQLADNFLVGLLRIIKIIKILTNFLPLYTSTDHPPQKENFRIKIMRAKLSDDIIARELLQLIL